MKVLSIYKILKLKALNENIEESGLTGQLKWWKQDMNLWTLHAGGRNEAIHSISYRIWRIRF